MATQRDKDGRFSPGQSGNPTGRKKENPEVMGILRAATPEAARRLVELIHDKNAKYAIQACNSVLGRVLGKPLQMQAVAVDVNDMEDVTAQIRRVLLESENDRYGIEVTD